MSKKDIKNFSIEDLTDELKEQGLERFRAHQMLKWLYQTGATSFDVMTNFKKELRERLSENYYISELTLIKKETSTDGCVKFLHELEDGQTIESVIIPDDGRNTLCVSSQVGCKMGCEFCLTAKHGFTRNLTISEILNQVLYAKEFIAPERVTNIVFMGMGEPLLNLENVVSAVEILKDDNAFGLSARRITVSTSGVVPQLIEICERTDLRIAVSLNAADDETRAKIMPINKKYGIKELIDACRKLPMKKRARITFEYVLISGVNDSVDDAKKLTKLLSGMKCKINLIPFNEHPEIGLKSPSEVSVRKFQTYLISKNFTAILRKSRGRDISAACGQLKGEVKSS
ncbi:23S rRNA (adenine(2503)-C(2))-methyltransferase RlmN [Thermodesulfobacteriota bacterium]